METLTGKPNRPTNLILFKYTLFKYTGSYT